MNISPIVMTPPALNEREFELINIIGAELGANQRDLSRHLNLSLGMTNILIRRLIAKGYIRIRQLNKRKVEYILTPEGFSEKMRKSVKYTLKTIRSISLIKERLKEILAGLVNQGVCRFLVLGSSDLTSLIEVILKENYDHTCEVRYIAELPRERVDGFILICQEDVSCDTLNKDNCINVLEEIARKNHLLDSALNP